MEKKIIKIDTFNPYECRFPNRKLISRDTLLLIKHLRNEGYEVIIDPEDNTPLQYYYKKGINELFSDPQSLFFLNISATLAINIISKYFEKLIDKNEKVNIENISIHIDNSTQNYNYLGVPQDVNNSKRIKKKRSEKKEGFERSLKIKSPFKDLPTPIFLEHEPKIIGWCQLSSDDIGLRSKMIITDKIVKRRVFQKRLKGLSVTGIATATQCSICNSDFIHCNHIPNIEYNGKKCFNTILETDYVEASIVKSPVNTQCLIDIT